MIIFQIIAVIFGLLMLYIIRIHYRKKDIEFTEFIFWIVLWLAFIYLSLFPDTFKGLIQALHFARVFDLLVVIAFMIITYLVFQNHISSKRIEKKIEEIVRNRTIHGK